MRTGMIAVPPTAILTSRRRPSARCAAAAALRMAAADVRRQANFANDERRPPLIGIAIAVIRRDVEATPARNALTAMVSVPFACATVTRPSSATNAVARYLT